MNLYKQNNSSILPSVYPQIEITTTATIYC